MLSIKNKKLYFLLVFFVFACINPSIYAQVLHGEWRGAIDAGSSRLPLVLHIKDDGKEIKGTLDSPEQGAYGIEIDKITLDNAKVLIEINSAQISYSGVLSKGNDTIYGNFRQVTFNTGLNFVRVQKDPNDKSVNTDRPQEPQPPFNYLIEEVEFLNDVQDVKLAGTLTMPVKDYDKPVVIMITGSGQQDRDETIMGHKPFWVIADYFAENGISSLRFDDRGIGQSTTGNIEEPTSSDLATDVKAAIAFLKNLGFKKIGLMGHSEGGIIAGITASQDPNLDFVILLSTPTIPGRDIILQQVIIQSRFNESNNDLKHADSLLAVTALDFTTSYKGNNFKKDFINQMQNKIKVLPEEYNAKRNEIFSGMADFYSNKWFQYFIKYDPYPAFKSMKMPVLSIYGTKDTQVPFPANYNKMNELQMVKNKNNVEVLKYDNLNHLLQPAETGAFIEYGKIKTTIAPIVLEDMKAFILKHTK